MNTIKLGTRASDLAMEQARETSRALTRAYPDLNVEIVPVHALGDHDKVSPIAKLGARGVFVSTLEDRLRSGEIDAAVHSLKDMPTDTAEGFVLAAVLERLDPRDVLLTSNGCGLKDLPPMPVSAPEAPDAPFRSSLLAPILKSPAYAATSTRVSASSTTVTTMPLSSPPRVSSAWVGRTA